ncbi:MAG: ferritin-like domain-containing protein, partial [bacterium]
IDSKYYAASQTLDEARHVEVFSRYVREKLDTFFPCTQNLFNPIQAIPVENRWDFKFLGMQMVVEGLAIAAFMSILHRCHEPLFEKPIRLVLRDEARHVAFGVIALDGFYDDMNEKDRRERQEFVYEACILMRGRLIGGEAFERMGLDPQKVRESPRDSAEAREFSALLFARIVPNMKKIGLLDGWLEERFAEMEVPRYRDFDSDAILESLIGGGGEAAAAARMAG